MANPIKGVKKVTQAAGKMMKFFSSFIGQIVFSGIAVALSALLIFVIAKTVSKSLAKLLGVDGGTQTTVSDYPYLVNLTSSGYDSMLNAKELADYHSFEYAVLMDAAIYLNDNPPPGFKIFNTSPIDLDKLNVLANEDDRWIWAQLNAAAFNTAGSANITDYGRGATGAGVGGVSGVEEIAEELPAGSAALVFESIRNPYAGEVSLYPYLYVKKSVKQYNYKLKDTNVDSIDDICDLAAYGNISRWNGNGEAISGGADFSSGAKYIFDHVFALRIVKELNILNKGAYGSENEMVAPEGEVDLYKDYSESLFYSLRDRGSALYRIPLRVLLDRFLPNSLLMTSWRLLQEENGPSQKDVIDEIHKIYSEASLEGEGSSGGGVLVKNVHKIDARVTSSTQASTLFDAESTKQENLTTYYDSEKIQTLYDSYAPKYDSRELGGGGSGQAANTTQNSNTGINIDPTTGDIKAEIPTDKTEPLKNNMVTGSTQTFGGTVEEDVIDDIKLVLAHHKQSNGGSLNDKQYQKALSDLDKVIRFRDASKPVTAADLVIYATDENGNYIKDDKGNMVTFLKVATDVETGSGTPLRSTAVVVCEQSGEAEAYKVANEEVDDFFSGGSSSAFAYFERGMLEMNVFGAWMLAGHGLERAEEYWTVEDAFEGISFGGGTKVAGIEAEVEFSYTARVRYGEPGKYEYGYVDFGEKNTYDSDGLEELGFDFDRIVKTLLVGNDRQMDKTGAELTLDGNILWSEGPAIVRESNSADKRDYEGKKEYPTNATPSVEAAPDFNYANTCTTTAENGETIKNPDTFINLKELAKQDSRFEESEENLTLHVGVLKDDISGVMASGVVGIAESKVGTKELISPAWIRENRVEKPEKNRGRGETMKAEPSDMNSIKFLDPYATSNNINVDDDNNGGLVEVEILAVYYELDAEEGEESDLVTNVTIDVAPKYAAVFPVEQVIVAITQSVNSRKMPAYLVKEAVTWSAEKEFDNTIFIKGLFKNPENEAYLVSSNEYAIGVIEWRCLKNADWRGKVFAPIFAGNDTEVNKGRETDVKMILAEWQEAADMDIHAADHFIRDLYALVNYSKGVKDNKSGGLLTQPIMGPSGPYILETSYTYMYIPDEILEFDDTTCEKAFWLDRLLANTTDPIDEGVENYMRSRTPTKTWQIVDYFLYEECGGSAYALWPYGGQLSRDLWVIASNASWKENKKVIGRGGSGWGGYSSAHPAADLYGRNIARKIFRAGYGNVWGDYWENGDPRIDGTYFASDIGLYFKGQLTMLRMDGYDYDFAGSASAAYGYEIYKQLLLLKDPDAAQSAVGEQLLKEYEWTEICAVAPGYVTEVKGNATSGFKVKIQHSDKVRSTYVHMKRFPLVQVGDYVGAGTLLGYEGTTGKSNGLHLHFTLGDGSVSPVEYLYPFFTPFYYEEKAKEAEMNLSSEYLSVARTVFPYQQYADAYGLPWTTDLEINETGRPIVKVQNYVPMRELGSVSEIYSRADMEDNALYVDYTQLPEGANYQLDLCGYGGPILETSPIYFSDRILDWFEENSGFEMSIWDRTDVYSEDEFDILEDELEEMPAQMG